MSHWLTKEHKNNSSEFPLGKGGLKGGVVFGPITVNKEYESVNFYLRKISRDYN
jgi:hypothetical protein